MRVRPFPAMICGSVVIAMLLMAGHIIAKDKKSKSVFCSNPHPEQLSLRIGGQTNRWKERSFGDTQYSWVSEELSDLHQARYNRELARLRKEYGLHGRL